MPVYNSHVIAYTNRELRAADKWLEICPDEEFDTVLRRLAALERSLEGEYLIEGCHA